MRWGSACVWLLGLLLVGTAAPDPARSAEITVGLYADEAGSASELTIAPNEPFWLYLLIQYPVLELPTALGHPMLVMSSYLRLRCLVEIPANLWIINFDESIGGLCGSFDQNTDPEISSG